MTSGQRGAVLAALFVLVASPIVMVWSWEKDRVDQCTVRGGTFDYAAMACDLARADHAFRPFAERHRPLVTGTLAAGAAAVGVGLVVTRRRA